MEIGEGIMKKVDKLPVILKTAAILLINCLEKILNEECDESDVINALNTVKDNSDGRYSKEELMNYDEAGRALWFGTTNRVGLKKFLDRNNVHQVKFGATKIGFPKSKVLALKHKRKY